MRLTSYRAVCEQVFASSVCEDPEGLEVKKRREIVDRCIALTLVYGCGPPGTC